MWVQDDLMGALKSLSRNYDHIVMIPGNHDRVFQSHTDEMSARFNKLKNVHLLVDSSIVLDGKKFYGSPWSNWFFGDYWAFNMPKNVSRQEVEQDYWGKIPHDVDVLITHGPPYGIMDACADGRLVGCKYLLEYVNLYKPSAHVFGHIHEGYGQSEINGVKFVNAAFMNGSYKPVNSPQVIEI
jgi:Icc-related predicted phosphoesterase